MKFVKRISLFFIYPAAMFGFGFVSNMAIQEFFYPGQFEKREILRREVQPQRYQKSGGAYNVYALGSVQPQPQPQPSGTPDSVQEAGYLEEPIITADTRYVVVSYDALSGETVEEEEITPDKYIGLTRQKLEAELKEYGESPSLTDQEKGFTYIELLSFSPARVVVRKSYERMDEGFFLINENHYVVVYDKTLTHIYMNTGIRMESLPQTLQDEIMVMKYIETENELFDFLESYSS